jgi:hypothetical protein
MKIELRETVGRCRWCGCTNERACECGCTWVNRRRTLCSACVEVDSMIKSANGRRLLAMMASEQS